MLSKSYTQISELSNVFYVDCFFPPHSSFSHPSNAGINFNRNHRLNSPEAAAALEGLLGTTSGMTRQARKSHPAAQAIYFTAVAFRRPPLSQCFEPWHRLTRFRQVRPQFLAAVRLAVQRLRNRRRAAHLAEEKNFNLKIAAVVSDLQHVSDPHYARRLARLPVRRDPSKVTGSRRQGACLEESGCPQPFVDAHAIRRPIFACLRGCGPEERRR